MDSHKQRVLDFLEQLRLWAGEDENVRALVLVGSFARGEARSDSDVDIVLMTSHQHAYVDNTAWTSVFGEVDRVAVEPYGRVTSVRAFYEGGLEVEFAIAPADWAALPLDSGTETVARGGIVVLMDRDGDATNLASDFSGGDPGRAPLLRS